MSQRCRTRPSLKARRARRQRSVISEILKVVVEWGVLGDTMPIAVYVLGLSIFAQGTSELMLAGLLPELSDDLGVSIPAAGLLISAFALGMLLGAPILAVLTLKWSRRTALLLFLGIFTLTHVA